MKDIIEKSLIKKIDRRGFLKTGSIASTVLILGLHAPRAPRGVCGSRSWRLEYTL